MIVCGSAAGKLAAYQKSRPSGTKRHPVPSNMSARMRWVIVVITILGLQAWLAYSSQLTEADHTVLVVVALVTWMLPGTVAGPSFSCLESRSLLEATCPHCTNHNLEFVPCSNRNTLLRVPQRIRLGQAISAATNDNKRSPVGKSVLNLGMRKKSRNTKYLVVAQHRECSGAEDSSWQSSIQKCANACKHNHHFAYGLKPGRCSGSKCKCLCENIGTKCRRVRHRWFHLYRNRTVSVRNDYFSRFREKCVKLQRKRRQGTRGVRMCAAMTRQYKKTVLYMKGVYRMSVLKKWTVNGDGGNPMPLYNSLRRSVKADFIYMYKYGYTAYGEGHKMYMMAFVKVIGSTNGKDFVVGKRLVRAFAISCNTFYNDGHGLCMQCYATFKPEACKALVPKWKAIPNSQCKQFGFAIV